MQPGRGSAIILVSTGTQQALSRMAVVNNLDSASGAPSQGTFLQLVLSPHWAGKWSKPVSNCDRGSRAAKAALLNQISIL